MQTRLKEIMDERGINKDQLCKMAGFTDRAAVGLMNGNSSVETLEKCANALGVPVWEMIVSCGVSPVREQRASIATPASVECPHCGAKLRVSFNVTAE